MHRLLALLTTLSTLHLMLVGGDVACAGRGSVPNAAMAGMSAPPSSHVANGHEAGTAERASPSTESTKECATPAQIHCCVAMSDCAVSATAGMIQRSGFGAALLAAQPEHVSALLASVPTSPEPPPPKA